MAERGNMKKYEIEILFNERKRVGMNLYELMRERGYTKISFSKAVNISRPTLNHLFEGEISSITTFEKHIEKINETLKIRNVDLMRDKNSITADVTVSYSWNEPEGRKQNKKEKEMFEVLESLINLCDYYY